MKTLFEEFPEEIKKTEAVKKEKCKNCKYCERWQCGTKFIFYCRKFKSNRTENKLLKIKANRPACLSFKL